jgi:hypothetical protein
MPNGDPNFELTQLPQLERFFAPLSPTLEVFANHHRLKLVKYEKENHSWDFLFRHPAGGVARIQALRTAADAVHVVGHWHIPDFTTYSRRTWSTDRGVIPRNDPQLTTVLLSLLKEMLALEVKQASPDGVDYRPFWRPENIEKVRASELELPVPAL